MAQNKSVLAGKEARRERNQKVLMERKKVTGSPRGDSTDGIPPEQSGNAIDAQPKPHRHACGFPIVGIGASAGGLSAFEAFFSGMPAETEPGMAFVLVQHLAPDHKSILTDLIRRYTRMQVFEVEDGMAVMPNCAYIIPPGRDMAFLNGTLQLLEPAAPRGQRMPIDFFFRSLAQDQHERAIGVVLWHRQRRHPGHTGHQGRGRHGHGPEPRLHRIRRHAA